MSPSLARKEETKTAASLWTTTARLRLDAVKTSAPNRTCRQEMLKLEIEALRNVVDSANRLYNSQTGICSLPPETLSEIFAYVKAVWSPSRTTYHTEESVDSKPREVVERSKLPADLAICRSGWMSLSHVCSYWREILLNTTAPWTSHANCLEIGLRWVPDIVLRSKTLPLTLAFDMRTKKMKNNVELADPSLFAWITRSVSSRLKYLSFVDCVSTFSSNPYGDITVDLPMDILEKLHVDVAGLDGKSRVWASNRLALVMRKWPRDTAPRLREVTLHCDRVLWNSFMLSQGLTKLHIKLDMESSGTQIPDYRDIAKLLGSCTSLKHLTLINAIPSAVAKPPPLALPHTLQYLELESEGRTKHCVEFLKHLTSAIPDGCTVGLDLNIYHELHYRDDSLAGPLRQAFAHLWNLAPPRELVVYESRYVIHHTVQPRKRWGTYAHIFNWRTYALQMNAAVLEIDCPRREWSILDGDNAPDLSALQALSFYHGFEFDERSISKPVLALFASAVNVKRIGLKLDSTNKVTASALEALSEWSSDSHSVSGFKLCPTFDTLVLTGEPYYVLRGRCHPVDAHAPTITALTNLVERRKEHGVPIREFFVNKSMRKWGIWDSLKKDAVVRFWR